MHADFDGEEWDSFDDVILRGYLGVCGCGYPIDATNELYSILTKIKDGKQRQCCVKTGASMLMLYFLDKTEIIEHGSSVGGAWLTKKGEGLLEALNNIHK